MKDKTTFESIMEKDPYFQDILEDFANRIKANLEYLTENNSFEIASNKYELPYDNKFETHNTKIYFLRIMCRDTIAVSDFSHGIIKFMTQTLGDEICKKLCKLNIGFYPQILDRTIIIKLI